ncbi:MAG: ABC transporter ATP-binding protein [Actinomycetota bacterium]
MTASEQSRQLDASIRVSRGDFELEVELEVVGQQTVVLLGPNGAGKSTVVDALAGVCPIDAGRIVVDDVVVDEPATATFVPTRLRGLGIVFQQYRLFGQMSVLDNVAFGPSAQGARRATARRRAAAVLELLGAAELASRSPRDLSGGQAQRVAIARALAVEPRLLVFDEPLAALDVEVRADLRRALVDISADTGALVITHDPTEAFLLADQIVVVEGGRVTQRGDSEAIRTRPATPYVAALTGTNLLRGAAHTGVITLGRGLTLHAADTHTVGPVVVTIDPVAVALHRAEPNTSARNKWSSAVVAVEALGERVRVVLGEPFELVADVTPAAVEALDLRPGVTVWASVKATELQVRPASN